MSIKNKGEDNAIIGHSISGEILTIDLLKKKVLEAQTRVQSGKYITYKGKTPTSSFTRSFVV